MENFKMRKILTNMTKSDYYKEVIDVLNTEDLDYKQICIELAKENPKIFYNIVNKLNNIPEKTKKDELTGIIKETDINIIDDFLKNDKKIQAIKHYRTVTNLGLKESKEAVDRWAEKLKSKYEQHGDEDYAF